MSLGPREFYETYVLGSFALSDGGPKIPYSGLSGIWDGWQNVLQVAALPASTENDFRRVEEASAINQAVWENWDRLCDQFAPSLKGNGNENVFRDAAQAGLTNEASSYPDQASISAVSLTSRELDSLGGHSMGSGSIISRVMQLSLPLKIVLILILFFLFKKLMKA